MQRTSLSSRLAAFFLTVAIPLVAEAQPVDLSTWTVESGPALESEPFDEPAWQLAPDAATVIQLENTNPTFFYSDVPVASARVEARLRVRSRLPQDDDFIGLAIGFDPGELRAADADYLLLDWKKSDQLRPDGLAAGGLALSRVRGIASVQELFLHIDNPANPHGSVVELARGATLGNTGWEADRDYRIELEILPGELRIFVDGNLELEVAGIFDTGRLACYNNSQPLMECGDITVEPLEAPVVSLDTWNDESYRFGVEAPGSWRLSPDATSAEQLNRNDASVFYSDFSLHDDVVIAELSSVDNSDDDYMGFVLGFDPGETQDPNAEYLLIDWKKVTQSGQIGGETFTADAGLAVSRVVGVPSIAELFGHQDLPATAGAGVFELARAALGGVGWDVGSRYVFTFEVSPTSLRVWVEDLTRGFEPRLELDLGGDFSAISGRFGCFSNSQPRVECARVRLVAVD